MPSAETDRHARERFLLDTLAERRAVERPTRRARLRAFVARGSALLRMGG